MAGLRVLVTGGAGFIGCHVVRELLLEGHQVGVLDSLVEQVHGPTGRWPSALDERARRWRGDVRDRKVLGRALDELDPQVVVHLAAEVGVGQAQAEPARYMAANVVGTAVLLEELATRPSVERLLVAGSMSAYGEGSWRCEVHGAPIRPVRTDADMAAGRWAPRCPYQATDRPCSGDLSPDLTHEWQSLQPGGVYAASKRDQEELALFHARDTQDRTVAVLRLFNVWGPGQSATNPYTGVVVGFAQRALSGLAPLVYEDGRQARDFVSVYDVAAAFRLLVGEPDIGLARRLWANPAAQGVFNVSTGVATEVLEVADLACEVLAPDLHPELPAIHRRGDIRLCVGSNARLRQLGWSPQVPVEAIRGLYEGMRGRPGSDRNHLDRAHRELVAQGLVLEGRATPQGEDEVPTEDLMDPVPRDLMDADLVDVEDDPTRRGIGGEAVLLSPIDRRVEVLDEDDGDLDDPELTEVVLVDAPRATPRPEVREGDVGGEDIPLDVARRRALGLPEPGDTSEGGGERG